MNEVYNNTFYIDSGSSYIVPNAWFVNNIFMADKQAVMTVQDPERGVFVNNCYAGNWEVLPADAAAVKADPLLATPAVRSEEANALEGYSLMAGSPCMDAGVIIDEHGGKDILGNVLPQKGKPDIGAVQH